MGTVSLPSAACRYSRLSTVLSPPHQTVTMSSGNTEFIAEHVLVMLCDRVRYINMPDSQKLVLNGAEKTSLRMTWNAWTAGDQTKRGFESFVDMFNTYPETKKLFHFVGSGAEQMQSSQTLLFHVSRVMTYIHKTVEHLDNLQDWAPMLMQTGGRHGKKGYNVPSEFFPLLGKCMRKLMKKDLTTFTDTHEKLWTRLFDFIIGMMVCGQNTYGDI